MRRIFPVILVIIMAGNALALTDISLGVYGGPNIPIAQEDTKTGPVYGLKAKVAPTPLIGAALFFEKRSFGDPEITVLEGTPLEHTEKRDGGDVTVFGLEALIGGAGGGIGPHFYWLLGIASYKWTREGFDDLTKVGYQFGPGLALGFPSNIGVEGRVKFEVVPTDGGGSRKSLLGYVGLNYHFGLM